jgi:hypothetical protein
VWIPRPGRVLAEIALMVSPLVVSDLLGRFALSSASTAFRHAEQIAQLERASGVDVEYWFTAVVGAHPTLHAAASGYYATVHVAAVTVAALAVATLRPERWAPMRTAFLITSGLGLLISRLWPLMPPNLAGPDIGRVGAVLPASHPPNAYAAMPSLHTAWALWTAVALVVATRHLRPALRWPAVALGVGHVAVTVAIVFGLGHHFLTDVLAGAAVVAAGVGGAAVVQALASDRPDRVRFRDRVRGLRRGVARSGPAAVGALPGR